MRTTLHYTLILPLLASLSLPALAHDRDINSTALPCSETWKVQISRAAQKAMEEGRFNEISSHVSKLRLCARRAQEMQHHTQ